MSTPITTRRRLPAAERRAVVEQAAAAAFADKGFDAATMDEIATASGVTVPVVYDHFPSKRALYDHLVERHYGEMVGVWVSHVPGEGSLGDRLAAAFDAWFAYVEEHPFALRLFEDRDPEPSVADTQAPAAARAKAALLPLVTGEADRAALDGLDDVSAELIWESVRAVLQTFARWRLDHPEVPRRRLVETAIDVLWRGFERTLAPQR